MSVKLMQREVAAATPAPRPARRVRVALAGCGVVGGELVRLLEAQDAQLQAEAGVAFEVVRVLVRHPDRPRDVPLPRERFTADLDAFLAAPADLVVEALGGVEPALQIARAALGRGHALVTANKALLAAHGPALGRLAEENGARLDFESAVGGGIPVIRALRDSLAQSGVHGVRGILNGTSNYILTRLAAGDSYAAALAEAQARGFAEADPARDVDGRDAADKIAVLAWLAFGADPAALPVRRRGIVPEPDRLAADARALGGVVRLVAECVRLGEGVAAAVEPVIVGADHELAQVRGEQNAVLVDTRWNGVIRLGGPGAGGSPTAAVLLADMVSGARALPAPPRTTTPAAHDSRRHRWLISVPPARGAEQRLDQILLHTGIDTATLRQDRDAVRALTPPVEWSRVGLAEHALVADGLRPVVARYEM